MSKVKHFKITDLLIGIVFTLLFLSIGVIVAINFRPLYYLDIDLLNIEETSGYGRDEISANYNALIDYSSPFFRGNLSFPTFGASPSGIQHFEEVKNIFTSFYILAGITLVAAIIILVHKAKKRDISYLFVSSLTVVILPVVVGLLLMIDFDKSFVIFHKLFFNNDYWIFDSATDPVINILPDTFFLHSALLIILIVISGSICLYAAYHILRKRTGIRYRRIPDIKV